MYCSKCGKEIEDGANFCPGCGSSVEQAHNSKSEVFSQENENDAHSEKEPPSADISKRTDSGRNIKEETVIRKKKSFIPIIIIGAAAAVLVLILIVIITGILVLGSPQRKYDKQLSLGQRYLDELDYEQAIAAYRAAIEIDPKQPEAYAGLANTYIAMEDYDSAREVLLEGIDATDSDILKEMLNELEEKYFAETDETGADSDSDISAQIPNDALEWNGHFYAIYDDTSSWEDAKTLCEDRNGHLATIMSAAENNVISDYVMSMGYYSIYFGCSDIDQSGDWIWVTGEPLSYTNWHEGEPNYDNEYERYGMYYFGDGTWNDGDFSGGSYICEWDVGEEDPALIDAFEEESPEGDYYEIGLIDVPGGYEEYFNLEYDHESIETVPNILLDATYKCQEIFDDALINETSDAGHWSISTLDEDYVDQILREFYHLDDDMISRIKYEDFIESERYVAYEGGNYVRYEGNVGGDIAIHKYNVTSVMFNGTDPGHPDSGKYRFEYEHISEWPDGSTEFSRNGYALMTYEKFNGTYYWTVYEAYEGEDYEASRDTDDGATEDTSGEEWKNAYLILIDKYYEPESYMFALVYIDDDDIPELVTIYDGIARPWLEVHTYYNGQLYESVATGNYIDYKKKSGLIHSGGALSAEEFGDVISELKHGKLTIIMSRNADSSGYYVNGNSVSYSEYEESFDQYSDINSSYEWMSYNEIKDYLN